jgi:hypothetical protein
VRDSCGTSGQVRPLKGAKRRGGSPHAPRKAKQPGTEINYLQEQQSLRKQPLFITRSRKKDRVARIQLSVHAVHIVFHADHSQFPAVDMQFHANMAKSRLMTSHLSSQKDAWLVKKRDIHKITKKTDSIKPIYGH